MLVCCDDDSVNVMVVMKVMVMVVVAALMIVMTNMMMIMMIMHRVSWGVCVWRRGMTLLLRGTSWTIVVIHFQTTCTSRARGGNNSAFLKYCTSRHKLQINIMLSLLVMYGLF